MTGSFSTWRDLKYKEMGLELILKRDFQITLFWSVTFPCFHSCSKIRKVKTFITAMNNQDITNGFLVLRDGVKYLCSALDFHL